MIRIAAHTTLYLFFFTLLVLFLYVIGNVQNFLEGTLLLLLRILEWSLFLFCITDIYFGLFSAIRIVRGGGGYAAPITSLVALFYGAGMLLLLNLALSWFFW